MDFFESSSYWLSNAKSILAGQVIDLLNVENYLIFRFYKR